MMGFINRLFRSGNEAKQPDARRGRVMVSVDGKSGRITHMAKGPLNHPNKYGEISYYVDLRMRYYDEKSDFIPDEQVMSYIVDNFAVVPALSKDDPSELSRYLKNRKVERKISIRELVYRKQHGMSEDEPLPHEYQNWLAIQKSKEIQFNYKLDIDRFAELIAQDDPDYDALSDILGGYVDSNQLFGSFIQRIYDLSTCKRRVALYSHLEPVIERSELYRSAEIENMDMFLNMPSDMMTPLHVLAAETLRAKLAEKTVYRNFISSLSERDQETYDKIRLMLYMYHKDHNMECDEFDDEFKMEQNFSMDQENLTRFLEEKGLFDDTDSDAFRGFDQDDNIPEKPELPADLKKEGGEDKAVQPIPVRMDLQEEMDGSAPKEEQTDSLPDVPRLSPDQEIGVPKVPIPLPIFGTEDDELFKSDEELILTTLQKLSRGRMLRDEIYAYKNRPAVTAAQMNWAFHEGKKTPDDFLSDGTLNGVLKDTVYFKQLVEKAVSYNGFSGEEFSIEEKQLVTIYAESQSKEIECLEELMRNSCYDQEIRGSIAKEVLGMKAVLNSLESFLADARKEAYLQRMMRELDGIKGWLLKTVGIDTSSENTYADFWKAMVTYGDDWTFMNALCQLIDGLPGNANFKSLYHIIEVQSYTEESAEKGGGFYLIDDPRIMEIERVSWGQLLYLSVLNREKERILDERHGKDQRGLEAMLYIHERLAKKVPGWLVTSLDWSALVNRYKKSHLDGIAELYGCFKARMRDRKVVEIPNGLIDRLNQDEPISLGAYLEAHKKDNLKYFLPEVVSVWYKHCSDSPISIGEFMTKEKDGVKNTSQEKASPKKQKEEEKPNSFTPGEKSIEGASQPLDPEDLPPHPSENGVGGEAGDDTIPQVDSKEGYPYPSEDEILGGADDEDDFVPKGSQDITLSGQEDDEDEPDQLEDILSKYTEKEYPLLVHANDGSESPEDEDFMFSNGSIYRLLTTEERAEIDKNTSDNGLNTPQAIAPLNMMALDMDGFKYRIENMLGSLSDEELRETFDAFNDLLDRVKGDLQSLDSLSDAASELCDRIGDRLELIEEMNNILVGKNAPF